MKKQNVLKNLMAGVLTLAVTVTAFALTPSQSKATAKPGKTAVENVEAAESEDGDAAGLKYSWKKVSGAKGYQYRYDLFWTKESTAKDFTKGLTKNTYAQISFQDNEDICFQVRAYKQGSDGKKVFGKWSAKKILTKEEAASLLAQTSDDVDELSGAYEKDMELYKSVISSLKVGQHYAFADINPEFDALLVADAVYDNMDGNMASIEATVYGFNKENKIVELGSVSSSGTAYPLAVGNGCLYYSGGHFITKAYADQEKASLVVKESAREEFDSNGKATYYYTGSDGLEKKQKDDSEQKRMLGELENTIVLNFFPVKK